jgi:GNAT superfamily N-acetyltransferase
METCKDIPSKIPFDPIPFEKWKVFLEPPFLNKKHSLIMMDGVEMIGLLNLGEVDDGKININYTAIKSTYRRRGLAFILKYKAFAFAKKLGAQYVTTQNHTDNPMLEINKKLGFVQEAVYLSFQKNLN